MVFLLAQRPSHCMRTPTKKNTFRRMAESEWAKAQKTKPPHQPATIANGLTNYVRTSRALDSRAKRPLRACLCACYKTPSTGNVVRDGAVNGYDTTELGASKKATLRLRARSFVEVLLSARASSVGAVVGWWWWRWCSVLRGYASRAESVWCDVLMMCCVCAM